MNKRELMFPDWQVHYFAAISEGSPEILRERVEDAEKAILTRLAQVCSARPM